MFTLKNYVNSPYQVLQGAIVLYKQCFAKAFPLAFLGMLFSLLPRFFIFPTSLLLGSSVICLLIGFVFIASMIFRIYCMAYEIPHHFSNALKEGIIKLFPLILLTVLYAIIVLSGTMLLIIPGIILAVSLMFSFVLLITDNQNILQALMSSHRLIWGHWWVTLFVVSFPLLFNLLLSLLSLIGLMEISLYFNLSSESFTLISVILGLIIQSLLLPFAFCTTLILIYHLKQKTSTSYVR
jgi:hypothetical protein